jgi:hypothetical protein
MVAIELADHKGLWFVEPSQREEWARTLVEQRPRRPHARLDFKSAGAGLQRIMRMEGFRDLRGGGGWAPLENGDAIFWRLDGTSKCVTAEKLRESTKRCEQSLDRRKRRVNIDDLDL